MITTIWMDASSSEASGKEEYQDSTPKPQKKAKFLPTMKEWIRRKHRTPQNKKQQTKQTPIDRFIHSTENNNQEKQHIRNRK